MKNQRLIWLSVLLLLIGVSCQKEVKEEYVPLVFMSLTATNTTFNAGSSVMVSADVQGTNIQYFWSYNSGSISGSGNYITYSNDQVGYHTLICTVKDGEGEIDAREISFVVQ